MNLAFYTFSIGLGPRGSTAVAGFEALLPAVLGRADAAPGFIARAKRPDLRRAAFGQNFGDWGDYDVPRFYDGGREVDSESQATTLSLWSEIAAVRDFAYNGLHHRALGKGRKWFREPQYPTYVMWWHPVGGVPTWREASRRLEYLHDHGPTALAFYFQTAFKRDGSSMVMEERPMEEY